MKKRFVLVVETDPVARRHLTSLLETWGYEPVVANSVDESLALLAHSHFHFSLLDLDLDGTDGNELLKRLRVQGGDPGAIIVITNGSGLHGAAEAAALGADDFVQKPFAPEELENAIKNALARPRRGWGRGADDDPQRRLQEELSLWRSVGMQEVRHIIGQAARADVTVLILGETGTGKDLVARGIHQLGVRQDGPFVKVNCAAVPRELLESELFGHERGAFTGAHQLKIGKFESADRGTIFLDEIGDLHPALQGKLLHVLQDGSPKRRPIDHQVDVRFLPRPTRTGRRRGGVLGGSHTPERGADRRSPRSAREILAGRDQQLRALPAKQPTPTGGYRGAMRTPLPARSWSSRTRKRMIVLGDTLAIKSRCQSSWRGMDRMPRR
jgi:DNA-binding NtrC family response regulator